MSFAEINLRVIYVLLQSDWFDHNLELEPLNPGRSAMTNVSFPIPANFRTRMHIRGKRRLARETSVRACVYACVRVCVCVRCCGRACVCLIVCVCFCVCVCASVFLHECVFVGVYSCVNVCS